MSNTVSSNFRFVKRAVTVIVVAMLLLAATLLLLRAGNREVYSVRSGSMAPTIRKGDAVVVAKTYGNLTRGDIVSFHPAGQANLTITHRISEIDTNRNRIVTYGDGATHADTPIGLQQVIGKVIWTAPYVGYAFDAIKHPLGLVLAVYAPAAVIIVSELRRLARHYATRRYVLRGYLHHVSR